MTGPRVMPQYQGPRDAAAQIAQAFYQRDATNRQRDMDAVTTGIGLQPIDPNAPPEHSPLSRLVGGVYSRLTGHANGNDVADANANMAQHLPSVSTTANQAAGDPGMTSAPEQQAAAQGGRLPGAFDPMLGGFAPSQASMMRLPSGQTVDMRMTPIGQRMQSGDMQRQLTQAQLGNYQSEADARRATMDQQQQTLTGRMAALKRLPQYATADDQTLRGIASDEGLFTKTLDPTPKAPVMGTPEWRAAKIDEAKIGNQYGYHQPQQEHYSQVVTMGQDGKPHVSVLNTTTGQVQETGALARPTGTGSGLSPITRDGLTHLPLAESADGLLDTFGATLSTRHGSGVLANIGLGKLDPTVQQANQAGEHFVTIVGPMLNHGRMTQQDIEQVRRTYVPQVGDTPDVLRQKSAARKHLLAVLKASGNPGAGVTPHNQPAGQSVPVQGGGLFDDLPSARHP